MNGPNSGPTLANTHALVQIETVRKTFKYRLYPTREQRRLLEQQLEACRWLYIRLLEERKTA
jgi:hypothetical protein